MKKLVFLCTIVLLASCTTPEIENGDENLSTPQIEIVENGKNWGFPGDDEWQEPSDYGIYGPSSANALETVTYYYIGTPVSLSSIPPNNRGFKVMIMVEDNTSPTGWETMLPPKKISSSKVNLKFPSYGSGSSTKWKIRMIMYNTESITSYSYEKEVIVYNKN